MNIFCKLGLHKWEYNNEVEYYHEMLAIVKTPARRICIRCHGLQERDEHCLGLNPPEYTHRWYFVKKEK